MAQVELGEKQLIISLEEYEKMKKENEEQAILIEAYRNAIASLYKIGITPKVFTKAKNFELKKMYNFFSTGCFRYALVFDLEEELKCK